MNILIGTTACFPSLGGVPTYIESLSLEFIRRGHGVTILCKRSRSSPGEPEPYKGMLLCRYDESVTAPLNAKRFRVPFSRTARIKDEIRRVLALLPPERSPDVAISRNILFNSVFVERLGMRRTLYVAPSCMTVVYFRMLTFFRTRMLRLSRPEVYYFLSSLAHALVVETSELRKIRKIATLSKNVQRQIARRAGRRSIVRVISPGVDTNAFKPCSTTNQRIIFVGRLTREKNACAMLRLSRMLPEAEIVIVGGGTEEQRLKTLSSRMGLANVEFVGWQQAPEVFLERSAVLVLPSIYEGFGHILLEAMASGLPCVAFRPDGRRFITASDEIIIEGQTGFLAESEGELAQKVRLLLEDAALRQRMGRLGRMEAEKYSWRNKADEILRFARE